MVAAAESILRASRYGDTARALCGGTVASRTRRQGGDQAQEIAEQHGGLLMITLKLRLTC